MTWRAISTKPYLRGSELAAGGVLLGGAGVVLAAVARAQVVRRVAQLVQPPVRPPHHLRSRPRLGPARHCSPRHRMPLNLVNEGSNA